MMVAVQLHMANPGCSVPDRRAELIVGSRQDGFPVRECEK
jgi:hypothetical protein